MERIALLFWLNFAATAWTLAGMFSRGCPLMPSRPPMDLQPVAPSTAVQASKTIVLWATCIRLSIPVSGGVTLDEIGRCVFPFFQFCIAQSRIDYPKRRFSASFSNQQDLLTDLGCHTMQFQCLRR